MENFRDKSRIVNVATYKMTYFHEIMIKILLVLSLKKGSFGCLLFFFFGGWCALLGEFYILCFL